jgi:hypothetical protein
VVVLPSRNRRLPRMTPEEVADHAPKRSDVALVSHEIGVASTPRIGTCVTVKVPSATSTASEALAIGIAQHGSTRLE